MNSITVKNNRIEDMIYEIRGVQVMMDSDLACIYKCTNGTKDINKAVKRNIEKFPQDFRFQLTDIEKKELRFQNGTTNNMSRTNPYAFTEQGVAMLATVIHTKIASEVSVSIMRAFVKMRHFIIEKNNVYKSLNSINNILLEHDEKINYLFSRFNKKEQLLLNGEILDGYLNILSILNMADKNIIVVDNYADITFLDLIRNIKCEIILVTKNSNRISNIEIDKYNSQYHNLKVARNNELHDRFIVIDGNEIYHIGTSLNSLGEKISMSIRIEEVDIKKNLLNKIEKMIN